MIAEASLKILVAEDNKINQILAKVILNKLGYEPDMATNGAEAIEMWKKKRYDVILMDVHMPVLNGILATKKIRESKLNQPIIIAMTAGAFEEDKSDCLLAGMNAYIGKPFSSDSLKITLEKASQCIRTNDKYAIN